MVIESMTSPKEAEREPFQMFFVGTLYATIALFLSLWIFKEQASLVFVFLTALACVPLMYRTLKYEESKDVKINSQGKIFKEHKRALSFFVYLFIGFVVALTIWYVILPQEMVSSLFSTQTLTINRINSQFTGSAANLQAFSVILANNIRVLIFCILFSFFYGAGAIFILSWNASVIATAVGAFIRSNLASYAHYIGFVKIAAYFNVFSVAILKYMTHGVFEIGAYFVGGLAGGIISVAIIRHTLGDKSFSKVLLDSINLLVLAIGLLVLAALVEVFVTPMFF